MSSSGQMTAWPGYLRWLRSQVGVQERPRGSNRQPYAALAGHANGEPWCATLTVAGARETGVGLPDGADTASCALNESAYKRAGRLSTTPRVGAVFFVYFPSLARAAHTGVVWKVDGSRVLTIEGNSNDDGSREGYEVCLRSRPAHRAVGAVGIRSYGMPFYDRVSAHLEDDMGLSSDDRAWLLGTLGPKIREDILEGKHLTNLGPNAAPVSLRQMIEDIEKTQDTDTQALAKLLAAGTAGADPSVIADAILVKLGPQLAGGVASELAARLQS